MLAGPHEQGHSKASICPFRRNIRDAPLANGDSLAGGMLHFGLCRQVGLRCSGAAAPSQVVLAVVTPGIQGPTSSLDELLQVAFGAIIFVASQHG